MGQPAARIGDLTSHGTPLFGSPGEPTVLIEKRPAWRAGIDVHVCPLVNGVQPHVGGVVAVGSATVFIRGMPAARVGDMCVCVGPPDVIALGSFKVLIGGMPAARMGDMTAHGGAIVIGCPTVLIN